MVKYWAMEKIDDSRHISKCDYCSEDIPLLTKKLQQHPSSMLWMRHGKCSVSCSAKNNLPDKTFTQEIISGSLFLQTMKDTGDTRPAGDSLNSRSEEERQSSLMRKRRCVKRTVTGGTTATVLGMGAGLIFLYYSHVMLVIAAITISATGIILLFLGLSSESQCLKRIIGK